MMLSWIDLLRLRRLGVKNGRDLTIKGMFPIIRAEGSITFGPGCYLRSFRIPIAIAVLKGGCLELGRDLFMNDGVNICAAMRVQVGDNVKIADAVYITDYGFHEIDEYSAAKPRPVRIGNNVWIGTGAIILPGTTIGDHSIVGAGAVVSGEVPPKVIVAGNPYRIIREINCHDNWVRK